MLSDVPIALKHRFITLMDEHRPYGHRIRYVFSLNSDLALIDSQEFKYNFLDNGNLLIWKVEPRSRLSHPMEVDGTIFIKEHPLVTALNKALLEEAEYKMLGGE